MFKKDFSSILELLDMFPDEQSCIDYLEDCRWGDKLVSLSTLVQGYIHVRTIATGVRTQGSILM